METTPANVQLVISDMDGHNRKTIRLVEGESAEQTRFKLSSLVNFSGLVIRSCRAYKPKTKEAYRQEWVNAVIEDNTNDGFEQWYRDVYL